MGGKGKGKGNGKGKGKGKVKGKGKGKGRQKGGGQQLRKELAGVVGKVMRMSDGSAEQATDGDQGNEKVRGRNKSKGDVGVAVPRRVARRNARADRKARRAHFFGGNRQSEAKGVESTKKKVFGTHGRGNETHEEAPAKRPRKKRRDDDDEEITSDEDVGNDKSKGKSEATGKRDSEESDEDDGDNGSEGEGDEEEEDEEEEAREDTEHGGEEAPDGRGPSGSGEGDSSEEDREKDQKKKKEKKTKSVAATTSTVSAVPGAYLPPHLRKAQAAVAGDGGVDPTIELKRHLRGTMNRVSEGNLGPSSQEMVEALGKLLSGVGSKAASEAFTDVLMPAAVGDPNISVLVLGCHAAMAAASHVLYGANFGAAVLLRTGDWLQRRLAAGEASGEATGEDARVAKNCVVFIALVFSFGLVGGGVIFDLVRFIFTGAVSEVRIELALTVLRYAGRTLRTECVDDFKEILRYVSDQAAAIRADGSMIQSRVDYLLRELQDLKNNKVSFTVMDRFAQTKNWLTTTPVLAKKKVSDFQLALPFRFLAEPPPVDWPLGAATAGMAAARRSARRVVPGKGSTSTLVDNLRAKAVEQRLSTDLRQNLFVALMGAEDFQDASERMALVAVSAKAGASEACLVIVHCAVREKVPNPFYEHVANSLCGRPAPWGQKFKHFFKRAIVQNMTQVHTFGIRAAVNFAELTAAFMTLPDVAVPIMVIRFIRFSEAGAGGSGGGAMAGILGLFLRHLTESLLHRCVDVATVTQSFGALRKYDDVREGMLLIVDGHVKPRALKEKPPSQAPAFWEKLRAARKELGTRTGNA